MTDPAEIDALRAALAAEQITRREAEARNSGLEAVIAHLRLTIAQIKRARFGASAERSDKLIDEMELKLEELEAAATEDAAAAVAGDGITGGKPP